MTRDSGAQHSQTQTEDKRQQLIALTTSFCLDALDQEYATLAVRLIDRLAQPQPPPFVSGHIEVWAAAVIHALCYLNFGFDSAQSPHTTPSVIANHFAVALDTISSKSKTIRDILELTRWSNEELTTKRMLQNNPFKQMQQILDDVGLGVGFATPSRDDDEGYTHASLSEAELQQVLGLDPEQMAAMIHYSPEVGGSVLNLTEAQLAQLDRYLNERDGLDQDDDDDDDDYDEADVEYHTMEELRAALGLNDEQIAQLLSYDDEIGDFIIDLSPEQEQQIIDYHQRLIAHDRLN